MGMKKKMFSQTLKETDYTAFGHNQLSMKKCLQEDPQK